jgi:hypothetical protein
MRNLVGGLVFFLLSIKCKEDTKRAMVQEAHRWRAPDDEEICINHSGPLNLAIGYFSERLYFDIESVLFSRDIFPGNMAFSRRYRKVFTYVLRDGSAEVLGHFCLKKKFLGISSLFRKIEEKDVVRLLSIFMSAALDRKITWAEIHRIIGRRTSKEGSRTAGGMRSLLCGLWSTPHVKKIKRVMAYFNEPEKEFIVGNKVDLRKFIHSKLFLVQTSIIRHLRPSHIKDFLDEMYKRHRNDGTCFTRVRPGRSNCTHYEELLADAGERFFEEGALLAKLDPRLMAEGCGCHESHDTVEFVDNEEHVILSLLCSLLYDAESSSYTVGHLSRAKESLRLFFEKHPRPFRYHAEVREDWAEVLDTLDDPCIVYVDGGKAEDRIAPGLFNICRVLGNLCGVTPEVFSTGRDYEIMKELYVRRKASDSYIYYLTLLVNRICNIRQGTWRCRPADERIVEVEEAHVDIDGAVLVGRAYYSGSQCIKFRLSCEEGKRRLELLECACLRNPKIEDIRAENMVDFLIEVYLRYYHNKKPLCLEGSSLGRIVREANVMESSRRVKKSYLISLLDEMFVIEDRRLHPRLREIKDALMSSWGKYGTGSTNVAYRIFTKCREHFDLGSTGEVDVYSFGAPDLQEFMGRHARRSKNIVCYLMKHNSRGFRRLSTGGKKRLIKALRGYYDKETIECIDKYMLNGADDRNEILWHMFKSKLCIWSNEINNLLFDLVLDIGLDGAEASGEELKGSEYSVSQHLGRILDPSFSSTDILRYYCKLISREGRESREATEAMFIVLIERMPGKLGGEMDVLLRCASDYLRNFEDDGSFGFLISFLEILACEGRKVPPWFCNSIVCHYHEHKSRRESPIGKHVEELILRIGEASPGGGEEASYAPNETCSICYDDCSRNILLSARCKGCKRFFHINCIGEWLKVKGECPLCRRPMNKTSWPLLQ